MWHHARALPDAGLTSGSAGELSFFSTDGIFPSNPYLVPTILPPLTHDRAGVGSLRSHFRRYFR